MFRILARRRFCRLFAAAPFAALIPLEMAAASAPVPMGNSAAVLHAQGIRLLRMGLRFERAAEFLQLAAEKEPDSASHQLALGCAFASRAASIAYAASFTHQLQVEQATFDDRLRDWEESREEMLSRFPEIYKDTSYESTRPKLPGASSFPTKDDNQPYSLTRAQVEKRLKTSRNAHRLPGKKAFTSAAPTRKKRRPIILPAGECGCFEPI